MTRACLYGVCAWLLVLPATRASIIVNWLDSPIVLHHGMFASMQTPLDLDGDGVIDFTFGASIGFVGVRSEGQNRYVISPSPPPNIGGPVEPLYPDYEIGPDLDGSLGWFGINTDFAPFGIWFDSGSSGNFRGHHAYMGIELFIEDNIHYGWINLMIGNDGPYGEIYSWAYESTPNTPIMAGAIPEPSTLLLLLTGGIGLLSLKRSSRYIR